MKNALRLASFALAVSACSQGALPSLPDEATEPVPTTIRLVGAPPKLAAGAWANMRAQVLDQFDEPLARQTIALAVRVPEGESPGLVPGLGNSCSTGSAGEACSIALESKGPMGRYTVALTSGPIQAVEHVIEVTPAVEDAELSFQVPGRPGLRFRNGDRDLLAFQVPVNLLASGDPVSVELRLTDRYGNPVPAALTAEVLAPAGARPEAGADAGIDAGVALDGGEVMDGGAPISRIIINTNSITSSSKLGRYDHLAVTLRKENGAQLYRIQRRKFETSGYRSNHHPRQQAYNGTPNGFRHTWS